ncbi:MAG TPA: metallophosphoesterase [Victivallales bacterium]|nr:metallophosphoesterase [Victivallales bacterium]
MINLNVCNNANFKNYVIKTLALSILFISSCTSQTVSVKKTSTETIDNKSNAESYKFIVVGDSRGEKALPGINVEVVTAIAKAIIKEKPEFVLYVGDIVYGQANRKKYGDNGALDVLQKEFDIWLEAMKPVYDSSIKVYPVRGNHDCEQWHPNHNHHRDHRPVWPKTKDVWDNVFSDNKANPMNGPEGEKNVTFSFIKNNSFVAGMDVYHYKPYGHPEVNPDGSMNAYQFLRVNQPWLDKQLEESKGYHVFTYTHVPAFKIDHYNGLQGDSYPTMHINYTKYRNLFWDSLKKVGARTYFCGHDHGYAHLVIEDGDGNPDNDIHQFTVGTGGATPDMKPALNGYNSPYTPKMVKYDDDYGYMVVTVDGPKVECVFKKMVDRKKNIFEEFDRFTYVSKNVN